MLLLLLRSPVSMSLVLSSLAAQRTPFTMHTRVLGFKRNRKVGTINGKSRPMCLQADTFRHRRLLYLLEDTFGRIQGQEYSAISDMLTVDYKWIRSCDGGGGGVDGVVVDVGGDGRGGVGGKGGGGGGGRGSNPLLIKT